MESRNKENKTTEALENVERSVWMTALNDLKNRYCRNKMTKDSFSLCWSNPLQKLR